MKVLLEDNYSYYKRVAWTQPTLSSNGSFGGNEFGVSAGATTLSHSINLGVPYVAFSPNAGEIYTYRDTKTYSTWINWYIPDDNFILTSVSLYNRNSQDSIGSILGVTLWGGYAEGQQGAQLGYVSDGGMDQTVIVSATGNRTAYKYYRLDMHPPGRSSEDALCIRDILISGYTLQAGTPEDYDFKVWAPTAKAVKLEDKYYGVIR